MYPPTSVYAREPSSEVDQGGELLNTVLLGVARVPDLDEGDVQVVSVIVNLLQLREDLFALGVVLVWRRRTGGESGGATAGAHAFVKGLCCDVSVRGYKDVYGHLYVHAYCILCVRVCMCMSTCRFR